MIQQVLAIWRLVPLPFSKSSLNIWKFTVHVLLKPGLENFEHYFTSVWDECNCAVVWAFLDIAFLWDWNENWPFPVLWPLLSFLNLLAYWVQHIHSIIISQDLKQLHWNPITSTSFVRSILYCSTSYYSMWIFSMEPRMHKSSLRDAGLADMESLWHNWSGMSVSKSYYQTLG